MAELEEQLRRALHDPAREIGFAADPVGAVHAGMRRRLRHRALGAAGTAALTAVAVLAVIAVSTRSPGQPANPGVLATSPSSVAPSLSPSGAATVAPSSTAPAVAPPTVAPSTLAPSPSPPSPPSSSPSPSGSAPPPAAGAVVTAVDLSFISATSGWALGGATCNDMPCTVLLRTTDGGANWRRAGTLAAELTPEGALCSDRPCVNLVRFANSTIGYAFGGAMFVTSDGGASWQQAADAAVLALEPAGGDVIRVVTATPGCPPGCTFVVQRSAVGSPTWTTLKTPELQGMGARLLRHGDDVYVFADQHRSGGAGDAHTQIIVSHDRGATWTQRPDPCSPVDPTAQNESDAIDAAIGVDGTFVMLCRRRDNSTNGGSLRVSTDGAATFGPARQLYGDVNRVAAGSARAIVVSAGSGSSVQLLLSTDLGRTNTSVLTTERATPATDRFLAFTTANVGTWIDGPGTDIWRTTDGGATWTVHPIG